MKGCRSHLHEQIQTLLLLQLCCLVADHRKIWLHWYNYAYQFKFAAQCCCNRESRRISLDKGSVCTEYELIQACTDDRRRVHLMCFLPSLLISPDIRVEYLRPAPSWRGKVCSERDRSSRAPTPRSSTDTEDDRTTAQSWWHAIDGQIFTQCTFSRRDIYSRLFV